MPMGTPEEHDPYDFSHDTSSYRFDPMTGKPLHAEPEDSKPEDSKPESDEDNFTHWVHLADGRVIKANGGMTHYFESDAPDAVSVPVIGVYPRP